MTSDTQAAVVDGDHCPRFTISQMGELVGIKEPVLRIWEHRYQWPQPGRARNGYRRYSAHQVAVLKAVRKLLDGGLTIGQLLADDAYGLRDGRIPDVQPPGARRVRRAIDFRQVPSPTTELGRRLRSALEEALIINDSRAIERVTMEGSRLHPEERRLAITDVVKVGITEAPH